MRPVRKGPAYQYADGQPYGNAVGGLVARLGKFCSYCEREMKSGFEVEHIQPKHHHPDLERKWANFLLACKNCNTTKSDEDLPLGNWLIPDRDNTFAAFVYEMDGVIKVRDGLAQEITEQAQATLDLFKLVKVVSTIQDESGNLVALDRRSQRLETWALASRYRGFWDRAKPKARESIWEINIPDLAKKTGFFSIWMAAFEDVPEMRQRFIAAFPGTEGRCFNEETQPVFRHPNEDNLEHGGKL